MFMAIRNGGKRRYTPPPPCPCNRVCPCHTPRRYTKADRILFRVFWLVCVMLVGVIIVNIATCTRGPRKIEVNGEMCEIHFKQTGQTSTGAPTGHDEVICSSWSK
jgi:hypothetical protein